jgi:hypothetical protein
MLRASLGASAAVFATRGCSRRSFRQHTSPWSCLLELRLSAAAHGCSWLLIAARGCSRLHLACRRLASTRPSNRSAGWAHRPYLAPRCAATRVAGRDALPGDLYARWSAFINAPRRRQPTQARAARDAETKCRLRDEGRRRDDSASTFLRWFLGIDALGPQVLKAAQDKASPAALRRKTLEAQGSACRARGRVSAASSRSSRRGKRPALRWPCRGSSSCWGAHQKRRERNKQQRAASIRSLR